MKKLAQGILDFRRNIRPGFRETFARLALGQSPDALFIACSDSRVAINLFASTDPGDLFVVRNVGNLIPKCADHNGHSTADESEAAAIEFALLNLSVKDIIICGHSECGAMLALLAGREKVPSPNLQAWLRHGESALTALSSASRPNSKLAPHNQLSQLNVLAQVENIKSYPVIAERIARGSLKIHAWWFELATASVHFFDSTTKSFVEIEDSSAEAFLKSL